MPKDRRILPVRNLMATTMEHTRYCQLFWASMLVVGLTQVASFGYLDSLSTHPSSSALVDSKSANLVSSVDYLDSLRQEHPIGESPSSSSTAAGIDDEFEIISAAANTPDDHYAKNHPGAGWGGYKHPRYGGYLDHLSSCDATNANANETNNCLLEAGKKADYGDDIRWGAQVYLDNL